MAEHQHEEQVKGVKVQATGDKQWQKDYAKSDMEVVYRRTHPQSWDDLIHWLEQSGESDNELTPGEDGGHEGGSDPAQAAVRSLHR